MIFGKARTKAFAAVGALLLAASLAPAWAQELPKADGAAKVKQVAEKYDLAGSGTGRSAGG